MTHRTPDSLPPEWLPERTAEDDELWEERLRRLVRVAEPRLARLRTRGVPWWTILATWWKPAAGLAAAGASIAVLLLGTLVDRPVDASSDAIVLSAVIGEGTPAALWLGLGGDADPVLAVIALEAER